MDQIVGLTTLFPSVRDYRKKGCLSGFWTSSLSSSSFCPSLRSSEFSRDIRQVAFRWSRFTRAASYSSVTNHRSNVSVILGPEMVRTSSSKAANTLAGALRPWGRFTTPCTAAMVQKRSVKVPGGAEVRRSTDRLACEATDQGEKRPMSTAIRKTEPKEAGWRKAA